MGDCSLGGLQKWFLFLSSSGRKGYAGSLGRVRFLNLEGHCVAEPWLKSHGVMLVRPAVALSILAGTRYEIPSLPSLGRGRGFDSPITSDHWASPACFGGLCVSTATSFGPFPGTPLVLHSLTRPLCLTIFLAKVGISLEMRQLTRRQPAGREPKPRHRG